MAEIFDPQGPLSRPCENTTVVVDPLIGPRFPLSIKVPVRPAAIWGMALEEEQANAGQEMRSAIDCLRGCADLGCIDTPTLERLAAGAVQFSLPAGIALFDAGSLPDGVYLLVGGRLAVRAAARAGDAREREGGREIGGGELVGEASWLLQEARTAGVVALRDSELLLLPGALLDSAAAASPALSLAIARLCARQLQCGNRELRARQRARVFAIVPNSDDIDVADLATRWVAELAQLGATELVWDVRASAHTLGWFHRIETQNDFVVYVADGSDSGWTRQCCRQADVILLAARAGGEPGPWPATVGEAHARRGARIDLALLHEARVEKDCAGRWLESAPVTQHHHIVDASDLGRVARLLTGRGVGLVLSGGGARGFAHLGVIQALREARVPIDFIGGVSIGSIIAAGVAVGWNDREMQVRYRRCFVDTNPVNDYTFPRVAITRGRKVTRLLEREYGDVLIEDLRRPFFCISADLASGHAFEHRRGRLAQSLRASVAIPGVMPPVMHGNAILVDGATINNLPVDLMQRHAPGLVIGCDVGADRSQRIHPQLHILQILMYAGLVHSAASAALQRSLADVLFKPPLANVDLLNWKAFDRAIEAGYAYARQTLETLPQLPRLAAASTVQRGVSSLATELERRLAAKRVEPVEAHGGDPAARRRMPDAVAVELAPAGRSETEQDLE
jgi:NTE family protein